MAQQKSLLRYWETVMWQFPVFDFNGVAANSLTAVSGGQGVLNLGQDGHWAVWGMSATACQSGSGGLANKTGAMINIYDVGQRKFWFTPSTNYAPIGVPLESQAGKGGDPKWWPNPRILSPGTRLQLYMAHTASSTPTGYSPYYVTLFTTLLPPSVTSADAAKLALRPMLMDVKMKGAESQAVTLKYAFGTTNLAVNANQPANVPLDANTAFLINEISCRVGTNTYQSGTPQLQDDLNPLTQEQELLISANDSVLQQKWNNPDPVPLWCFAGRTGSRGLRLPTYFYVNPNANFLVNIINGPNGTASAAVSQDIYLTFSGFFVPQGIS